MFLIEHGSMATVDLGLLAGFAGAALFGLFVSYLAIKDPGQRMSALYEDGKRKHSILAPWVISKSPKEFSHLVGCGWIHHGCRRNRSMRSIADRHPHLL